MRKNPFGNGTESLRVELRFWVLATIDEKRVFPDASKLS